MIPPGFFRCSLLAPLLTNSFHRTPHRYLEGDALVAWFERLRKDFAKHAAKECSRNAAIIMLGSPPASPQTPRDSRNLMPMRIADLQIGVKHAERILHGEVCAEPLVVNAAHSVVRDLNGDAVRLSVYDLDSNAASSFKKGARVAIKEPYFKGIKGSLSE
ncbi:hypothetical protein HDU98_011021 [Podochytrium sp. JEL0797]|nr:hypothetical protein HDU98_011021 [Podochytrium sp. JEL0797]